MNGRAEEGQVHSSGSARELPIRIVAGTNDQTKTIILDCPAYGGNSVVQFSKLDKNTPALGNFGLLGLCHNSFPPSDVG